MAVYGCALTSLALLTPHLAHFYLVFVVIGIVGNGTTQMGYARAVSSWFDRRRGVALALVMAGTGVGSMILPPFAQMIISTYGWRTAYIVLGFSVFVFGLPLTAAFVREKPGHRNQTAHPEDTGSTVKRSLRDESVLDSRSRALPQFHQHQRNAYPFFCPAHGSSCIDPSGGFLPVGTRRLQLVRTADYGLSLDSFWPLCRVLPFYSCGSRNPDRSLCCIAILGICCRRTDWSRIRRGS